MKTIRAIVPRRRREENTFAVVEAEVDDDFADEQTNEVHALFGGIQQAVTDWFDQTDVGKSAICSSNDVFNVGELAEWRNDESFLPLLKLQGIHCLSTETHCDMTAHSWEFDDVLLDKTEINT